MANKSHLIIEILASNFITYLNKANELIGLELQKPIPMILHCPACHTRHIDKPDLPHWTNPPHKSHLCTSCGEIWRPCDMPTTGVEYVETKGADDTLRFDRENYEFFHGSQPITKPELTRSHDHAPSHECDCPCYTVPGAVYNYVAPLSQCTCNRNNPFGKPIESFEDRN